MYFDPPTKNDRPILNVILTLVSIFSVPFLICTIIVAFGQINETVRLEKRYKYRVETKSGICTDFMYCDSIVNDVAYNDDGKTKLIGNYKVKLVDKNKWN